MPGGPASRSPGTFRQRDSMPEVRLTGSHPARELSATPMNAHRISDIQRYVGQ
jgi:hypothetical protein